MKNKKQDDKYNKPKIALFIGRFQPFHIGHYKALIQILKKYKRVVIGLGSSNQNRSSKNPFLAKERKEMIEKVIKNKLRKHKKYIKFAEIEDQRSDFKWIEKIKKRFPPSKYVICSANPLVLKLSKMKNYEIFKPKFFDRKKYEGRKIRKMIFNAQIEKVKKLVFKEVYRYIKINLNKIKKLSSFY